ncbi:MAG TPA: GNAT family N-acetyltransferase [Anaerolineales bacterium]|nr:GNAT family N-acetyltransferase [Anaerolineales bacterium]
MPELILSAHHRARSLFSALERSHALVAALFEGGATARLFVDDVAAPQAGVIVCNSRVLCAGDTSRIDFLAEMAHTFSEELIPAHRARGNDAYLIYASGDAWNTVLPQLFSKHQLYPGTRQYYEIVDFAPKPDLALPEGFSMQRITSEFLSSDVTGLDAVREEMCSERTSVKDFLAHSFGLCPVHSNEVAGWCMSEYNVGDRCEIGIATAEKHQRQGIATLTTWFFLAEAYRRGYRHVGWDCWARNVPSVATARKAGFTLVEEYPAVVVEL